jgi:hypothetical protein
LTWQDLIFRLTHRLKWFADWHWLCLLPLTLTVRKSGRPVAILLASLTWELLVA